MDLTSIELDSCLRNGFEFYYSPSEHALIAEKATDLCRVAAKFEPGLDLDMQAETEVINTVTTESENGWAVCLRKRPVFLRTALEATFWRQANSACICMSAELSVRLLETVDIGSLGRRELCRP